MTEQNQENKDTQYDSEFDAAGRSLSEALRISFIVLKIIMIVLVGLFLLSGFETVDSGEQALVLRFGKINRILGPGLKWVFPYPIEKIIKIPVKETVNLSIDRSFWYFQTDKERLNPESKTTRIPDKLYPIRDGYCITRSEQQDRALAGFIGSDYNIVHCKWQLTYKIDDDPENFFKNVYVPDVKPGQIYFDFMKESIIPLLKNLFEDAVVTTMVHYTLDEAISSKQREIRNKVWGLLQHKLTDEIESGITVVSVQLIDITWPRQVDLAFQALKSAIEQSETVIEKAKTYAEETLNQAVGPVAPELLAALADETVSEEEKELLWDRLAGAAQEKIAQARAYHTKVVNTAKADAEYLLEILPGYRENPELVLQEIYLDAIQEVLANADEKIIIQSTEGAKDKEYRIYINRNPRIKPKSEKE